MGLFKRIDVQAKIDNETGFGTTTSYSGNRLIHKDGSANVKKKGIGFLEHISWYHWMLTISSLKFWCIVLTFYLLVNLVFAVLYYSIGVENLNGIVATTELDKFGQAFFFSVQTFTTVGYGHINPTGFVTSFVSSIEALVGLLTFAIATGLFFGRFSKPRAYVRFSKKALIAPYKDGRALMIRVAPYKNTNLIDAVTRLTLGISTEEDGKATNKFYSLDLELERINALTLSWTIVHPITEDSPLYHFTEDDFKSIRGEFVAFFKTFDDMYSASVIKRTSYTFDEIVYGAKFLPMFSADTNKKTMLLHLDKLSDYEKVSL
ncbi:ion channel [Flavobacterium chuncheonense]|uniref:Ion channel n=1 Tax=Flavobacterium chuncheonense TaxID=2026653 RepID=A0ABW5YJ63_9FLAO